MFYTYLLLSWQDKKMYIGFTSDLKSRLREHVLGKVQSTKNRRPLKLIYYEAFLSREDALKKEKYYKSGTGRKYIKRHLTATIKHAEVAQW